MSTLRRKMMCVTIALVIVIGMVCLLSINGSNWLGLNTDTDNTLLASNTDSAILIESAEDFAKIRNNLTGHYIQTQDIDLSELSNFTGIGKYFRGNYDGQRYKIKNVSLNSTSSGLGLFGINRGTIKNVIIDDGQISGKSQVGAIAGANLGVIDGCTNNAKVVGNGEGVGGIVGSNSGTVEQCSNKGIVENSDSGMYTGGICGSNLKTISQCYNSGKVTGGTYVAGIAGNGDGANYESSINQCYNIGEISGIAKAAICGDNWNGTVENVLFSSDTGLEAIAFNSGQAVNVKESTLSLMRNRNQYNWTNFDNNWLFMSGYKYPSLMKEYVEVKDVDFTGSPNEVRQGEEYKFKATFSPSNATPIKLNYDVVTGGQYADMEAESGTISIDNTAKIGADVTIAVNADGKTFTHAFKIVKNDVQKVTIQSEKNIITYGETIKLASTILPSNATYQNVSYKYDEEFVIIENDEITLKRGCPEGYEFSVIAVADGVESNALRFTVEVIKPISVAFSTGNILTVNPGDIIDLTEHIEVSPKNAQFKFIESNIVDDEAPLSFYTDNVICVDFMAETGVYEIEVSIDGIMMDNKLSINVVYPQIPFDFYVNPLLINLGSSQLIQYRFYDELDHGLVDFSMPNSVDGIYIETKMFEILSAQYLSIDSTANGGAFSIKATTEDGLERIKTYDIAIPVNNIEIEVDKVSKNFCKYVETLSNGDLVFNITPNSKLGSDRSDLIINLLPINTTETKIKYIISEHEEIVSYDQLNNGKLLLKLFPLNKTTKDNGESKQFKVVFYAGKCERTVIFKVVPVEVKKAVIREQNNYPTNAMYVGNTYNFVLEPQAFATDLNYAWEVDSLAKNFLTYEVDDNSIMIRIIANPQKEEIVTLSGSINGVSASINLHIKVAVESIDIRYQAENRKFEAGRTVQCILSNISPAAVNDKNIKYRIISGYEAIDDSSLKEDEDGYYISSNPDGSALYRLREGGDYVGTEIVILAVAHNGITSEYSYFTVEDTSIDSFEMTKTNEEAVPTSMKQSSKISFMVEYSPKYYYGDVQIIFHAGRTDWFNFDGKNECTQIGNELIYTTKASEGKVYLYDFGFTTSAVIDELFYIKVRIDNQEQVYEIKVNHGLVISASISETSSSTLVNMSNVQYLEKADVTLYYQGQEIGKKSYSYNNNANNKSIDLTEMLCFVKPEKIHVEYFIYIHYNTDKNQEITAKDVRFVLSEDITGFNRTIDGNQYNYWNKYKNNTNQAYLSLSKFDNCDIEIPSNMLEVTITGEGLSNKKNTKIIVSSRTSDLCINLDNVAISGYISINSYSKTLLNFKKEGEISSTSTNNAAIYSQGDIEIRNGDLVRILGKDSDSSGGKGGIAIKCNNLRINNVRFFGAGGGKGGNGSNGSDGNPGEKGDDGVNYKGSYLSHAHGKTGGDGTDGTNGTNGGDGGAAIECNTLVIDASSFSAGGGAGGKGGNGGNGGQGGTGGNGAATTNRGGFGSSDKNSDDAGNGGTGGKGGNGGNGGKGGDGGKAVVANQPVSIVNRSSVAFRHGDAGAGGVGGNGGNGGTGGKGGPDTQTSGQEGFGGNGGNGGNAGTSGESGLAVEKVPFTRENSMCSVYDSDGAKYVASYTTGIKGYGGDGGAVGDSGAHDSSKRWGGSPGENGEGRDKY
ncbi:MAG: hypothetical protein HDT32_03825 [Clostridiales bacterium]|nr:hypothetical protein [Clostridiales bacterium]